jgi:hypothetical protein
MTTNPNAAFPEAGTRTKSSDTKKPIRAAFGIMARSSVSALMCKPKNEMQPRYLSPLHESTRLSEWGAISSVMKTVLRGKQFRG